ncbi:MAG: serine/threonine transporter SstT [Enterococcus sp.]
MVNYFKNTSLIQRIIMGIIVGALLGVVVPQWAFVGILGELFVGALKAIAPLLVFVLIMSSISKHQSGTKTFIKPILFLYLTATILAAFVAVIASYLFPVTLVFQDAVAQDAPSGLSEVLGTLLNNLVQNPIQALGEGNYLSLLFWATLIGIALRTVSEATKKVVEDFSIAITKVVQIIISLAPLGILGLVYSSVATTGIKGLSQYAQLLLVLVGTMLFVYFIVYPTIVYLYIRQNPFPLVFFCLKESAVPAFFTRSSAANIPVNMMLAEKMNLTKESYSISLPLGATINMGGAAVTITVMTLATAHSVGIMVSPLLAFLLCLLSALSACGASGVAGGSLLLIPLACNLFGIPSEISMQAVGVGFIVGVVQDSMETAINSSSDLLFTAAAELRDVRKSGQKINLKERLVLEQLDEA